MIEHRTVIVALAFAALLVPAGAAHAKKDCARSAKVKKGVLSNLSHGQDVRMDARIGRSHAFGAKTRAVVVFQDVRYEISAGSNFMLACFGHSPQQGAIYPRLSLRNGTAVLKAKQGKPGAISTLEGMADPYADRAMAIRVKRMPKHADAFAATSTMKRIAGGGHVNVTPYVGPRPGTCRQVKAAKFVSWRGRGGYLTGRAKYRGYSKGSPR